MTELSERARLIGEFQAEGIHIALPIDVGVIAILASLDPIAGSRLPQWVPIHVVTMSATSEWISRSIEAIGVSGLAIAFTHHPGSLAVVRTYALTPAELVIVKMVGLIAQAGIKRNERPPALVRARSAAVEQAMAPYAVGPTQWRKKLTQTLGHAAR